MQMIRLVKMCSKETLAKFVCVTFNLTRFRFKTLLNKVLHNRRFLFDFALGYARKKVHEYHIG
jgi:hypothetical protein